MNPLPKQEIRYLGILPSLPPRHDHPSRDLSSRAFVEPVYLTSDGKFLTVISAVDQLTLLRYEE